MSAHPSPEDLGASSPATRTESLTLFEAAAGPARAWRTVVHDDPINLMSYVQWVFQFLLWPFGRPRPQPHARGPYPRARRRINRTARTNGNRR